MLTSTQLTAFCCFIFGFIFYDVFCGDVTNIRTNNAWQVDPSPGKPATASLSNSHSTTPWPALGQRWVPSPTPQSSTTSQSPKKWVQQNNIWVRNEQGSPVGSGSTQVNKVQVNNIDNSQKPINSGVSSGLNRNQAAIQQNNQLIRNEQGFSVISSSPKPTINRVSSGLPTGIQQNNLWIRNEQAASSGGGGALINNPQKPLASLGTGQNRNQQAVVSNQQTIPRPAPSPTQKPVLSPSSPRPGAAAGIGGTQVLSGSVSPTQKPTLPGMAGSYAGVAAGNALPSPPVPPKTGSGSTTAPKVSGIGGNLDSVSAGPGDLGGNQNVDEKSVDGSDVTDDQLREFSEMLIKKDTNNAMKYVTLNLQCMTTSRSTTDAAPQPLLTVNAAAYQIPSVEKLLLLYNNYILESSQNEVYTPQERIEENNLLDTVLSTPVMQFARSFLIQKGKIGRDPREFRDLLRLVWFNMYSRGQGRIGSSGFEHVFLAEIKNSQVSGLHNWIYFNEEEAKSHANYLGYLKKIDLGEKGAIVKYHFRFNEIDKPVGSMFIGTSPELEMAVYTTCFVLRPDRVCPLKMGGNKFVIRTYTYRYRGKNMIGSAFPEI